MPPKAKRKQTGGSHLLLQGPSFLHPKFGMGRWGIHKQYGAGFFSDVGNFFKTAIPAAAKKAANWIKDKKVISRAAGMIPNPFIGLPARIGLEQLGLGISSDAHKWVKGTKLISHVTGTVKHPLATTIGTIAKQHGYGAFRPMPVTPISF